MFVATFPPPVLISKLLIEPVTVKEPVISADPVKGKPTPPLPVLTVIGNVVPLPLVNVIVFDNTDAVVIAFGVKDAVEAKLELKAYEELTTNEAVWAFEALKAYEELITYEAVWAVETYEAVWAVETYEAVWAVKTYEAVWAVKTYEAVWDVETYEAVWAV